MKTEINRIWAMPNKWTFTIKPIRELIQRYVGDGIGWIDPFAGENSPAEYTNDINPLKQTKYHFQAMEFLNLFDEYKMEGILFDPPYSLRQLKECYNCLELRINLETSQKFPGNIKNAAADKIFIGGYAITFGWNSEGFGKNRGFDIVEILLVPHGGNHNDTIVTVEKKIRRSKVGDKNGCNKKRVR